MNNIKLVKFGAQWCGPCKMLDPILHELKDEQPTVEFEFVDIETDDGQQIAESLGIMGIPRVMIYKNDEVVEDFTGFLPKLVINSMIEKHI